MIRNHHATFLMSLKEVGYCIISRSEMPYSCSKLRDDFYH